MSTRHPPEPSTELLRRALRVQRELCDADAGLLREALLVQRDLWLYVAGDGALDAEAIGANVAYIEAVLDGQTPEPWREPPPVRQPRRGEVRRVGA